MSLACALVLSGCTFPTITPGQSPEPTPSEIAGIAVSSEPGKAVDRPSFPDPEVRPEGFATPPEGDGLSGYLGQQVNWADCGDGTDCATVLVPLDYANPGDQAITLAVRRGRATAEPRLGSLFLNPGGPGSAARWMVDSFAREGLEQYDIVAWDPRGTGESTPVRCFGNAETDAYNNLDASPDDDAERAALLKGAYDFGKACWERSGRLLEHISTIETVRDLDLLRHLLGDEQLHYLGYSYGTEIGATYAEVFPYRVGRLVLDAAVDITDDDEVIQAMGFDLALGNFAAWCAEQDCALGGTRDDVLSTTTRLLDDLDIAPLTADGRTVTQSLAMLGIAQLLYGGREAWPTLAAAIDRGVRGDGRWLLWAADQMNARSEEGSYSAMFYAFPAISCLDEADDGVLDAELAWAEDQAKAPIFGKYFGPQYACAVWPVRPAPDLDLRGAGADPILVIGGTGDNATPYQQAVSMAEQLESGVLVTYEGEGHGTYGNDKSACVDAIVVDYLVHGSVPEDGFTCS